MYLGGHGKILSLIASTENKQTTAKIQNNSNNRNSKELFFQNNNNNVPENTIAFYSYFSTIKCRSFLGAKQVELLNAQLKSTRTPCFRVGKQTFSWREKEETFSCLKIALWRNATSLVEMLSGKWRKQLVIHEQHQCSHCFLNVHTQGYCQVR